MFTRPRIIPTLLIDNRDLIKTVNFDKRTYLGDPVNAVKIFNRKGIDELSILDIGATKNNREPDYELLKDIASEAFMPLSYGGGINNIAQIHDLLAIGYEKIIINSMLVKNPQLIKQASEMFGSQSIVASIDVKKVNGYYKCFVNDGEEITEEVPIDLAKKAESLGAGEIILNSIDKDGLMSGYDIKLVSSVADAVKMPVIAIGGAGSIKDLKEVLSDGHAHAAAGGSMFVYYGRLKAVLITAPNEQELIEAGIYTI
ncbi:MAG: AglZ/HisF2 family acetamidino modification protein [Lachnospiraceae bacterium]|nr:AglZ/HisF2 family acetamidino modification protein [Lachnospiraceae bacterium]